MIGFMIWTNYLKWYRALNRIKCFSSHKMKGTKAKWWTSTMNRMMNLGILKDWEHFKATFLDKYFSRNLRSQKELEFQQLRQGNVFVVEYAEKFEDMVAYFRKSAYALDER